MPQLTDDKFYDRADAHIHLANDHCRIWRRAKSAPHLCMPPLASMPEYEKCLAENLDDYIENFDKYMKPKDD